MRARPTGTIATLTFAIAFGKTGANVFRGSAIQIGEKGGRNQSRGGGEPQGCEPRSQHTVGGVHGLSSTINRTSGSRVCGATGSPVRAAGHPAFLLPRHHHAHCRSRCP